MSLKKITCYELWQDCIDKMELQILIFLTYGLSVCEISNSLNIPEDSILIYLAGIIEKYGQF
jgi:hypothetical protein